jgi:hypothetical protein
VKFLKAVGSGDEMRSQLAKQQLSTQIIEPQPGDRFELPLQQRRLTV